MGKHIACIGSGNMAEAIVRGWLTKRLVEPSDIVLADISKDRLKELHQSLGLRTTTSNTEAVGEAGIVLLAVKPQKLAEVLASVQESFLDDCLVISIAAGKTTDWLEQHLPDHVRILRVMPNTPALVKQGMSCLAPGPRCTEDDLKIAEKLFRGVGEVANVEASEMDAVTAVSGSGPAYVFYLMEQMTQAAEELGLEADLAQKLVRQTLLGAATLAAQSEDSPKTLRERVTSKGGTTEAALKAFEDAGIGKALRTGIHAAAERSRELSGD